MDYAPIQQIDASRLLTSFIVLNSLYFFIHNSQILHLLLLISTGRRWEGHRGHNVAVAVAVTRSLRPSESR